MPVSGAFPSGSPDCWRPRAGIFVLLFWAITLATVAGMTVTLPNWESAAFFSASLAEPVKPFDFVGLYVPVNPFHALSNGIVPAVVVFSLATGIAVIGVPGKTGFICNLEVMGEVLMPRAELITVKSPRDFFSAPGARFDALLYSAESGSAWTLIYPKFSVVVSKPRVISVPVAYAVPRNAPQLHEYLDTWIALRKRAGILDELYEYWILGRGAEPAQPRWSVIRDVLDWVN